MPFALSEEQQMLSHTARQFLDSKASSAVVRSLMETDSGFDGAHWSEIAQMGWQAMHIPEQYGGAGFTIAEVNVLMEEMGRSLFPSPFFSTVVLGVNALLESKDDAMCERLLPSVASGETRLALAHVEADGRWDPSAVEMRVVESAGALTLSGEKHFVVDGHTADVLLVAAREPEGLSLFAVDGDADGVVAQRVESLDMTRKLATIVLQGVRVGPEDRIGAPGSAESTLDNVLALAAVSLAAEQVGGAFTCLDMSVEYAKVRKQFGRPIGSFQAIKHQCANMLIAVESAKSASYHATRAAADHSDDLSILAPLVKAYCSDVYFDAAADTIQIHGGIGFTWEHDAHLYFKRAKSSQLLLGTPAMHRANLANHLAL